MADSGMLGKALLQPELDDVSIEALRTAPPDRFTRILEGLLDRQVDQLHMRVGLVPNYFMTRGETADAPWSRKAIGKFFKLFHQADFREEQAYVEFEQIMQIVGDATRQQDSLFCGQVAAVLNREYRDGNSLLHVLVQRRHLRFLRTLLLYANNLLDLDQRNIRGYTALDLAVDRLEVEMVHLLLFYGASANRLVPRKPSLGYMEWLFYDMTLNLDTGRWIHKQSEISIMEDGQVFFMSPGAQAALLQWTSGGVMSDGILQQLGRMPRLYTIVLADGSDAITNHEAWATMIRHFSFLREQSRGINSAERAFEESATTVPEAVSCSDLCAFLEDQGADTSNFRTAGRTVFFTCLDGSEIAVKLSKSLEDSKTPHPLAKEAAMNTKIAHFKQEHGLRSDYPVTVQLLRLSNVPQEIREAVHGQQAAGYHPFALTADEDGVTALVYRPPADYSLYANDPSLSLEACRSGIEKAGYDAAVLARQRLYHGALVDIQHDASREQRPHLWSFESFLTRFRGGAGRIERGYAGLGAPNVRASGLGDLKHVLTQEQAMSRYDPSVIHAQHNILYNDEERGCVAAVEQLGASLFATALLAGSSWQSRHVQGTLENLDLAQELKRCFSTFLCGYLDIDTEKAEEFLELVGADFELMAAQMKMFSTLQYVEIAETARRRPFFGVFAKFLGWFTHPTAFVHFAQRGSLDLSSKPDRSLSEIRECYGTSLNGYPRVDTSMMRCSPTWVRGKGWVNSKNQAHLGSYEGVLPFQQLIRDLYVTVYMAWLVQRHGKESFELFM